MIVLDDYLNVNALALAASVAWFPNLHIDFHRRPNERFCRLIDLVGPRVKEACQIVAKSRVGMLTWWFEDDDEDIMRMLQSVMPGGYQGVRLAEPGHHLK